MKQHSLRIRLVMVQETKASLHCINSGACSLNRAEGGIMISNTPIMVDNLQIYLTCSLFHQKQVLEIIITIIITAFLLYVT